jgi:hypothetical protein
MSIVWGVLLIAAVLWPGRIVGPIDGAPLDAPLEAVLFAGLVALWFLAPAFLKTRRARVVIGSLLVWKIAGWLLLTQTGLCGTFLADPGGGVRPQPGWDVRALWTPRMGCTAVVTRPYREFEEFPAWAINVLPDSARPPAGSFALDIKGVVETSRAGKLTLETEADSAVTGQIDGESTGTGTAFHPLLLSAGAHDVNLHVALGGVHWRLLPRLDTRNLFDAARTFVAQPTRLDRLVRGWGRWVSPALFGTLFVLWTVFAASSLQLPAPVGAWAIGAAAVAFVLGVFVEPPLVRFCVLLMFTSVALRVPEGRSTMRTAFVMVAIPWLAFYAGRSLRDVGHFIVYTSGDDWWTFQRHAYQVFIEGFWLEGGEKTFWNQPLYRWTAGVLHLIFGDSSAGEMYSDASGIAVGAMFAFDSVSRLGGFRLGLIAAILVLNVTMLGPNWYGVGRGLSEISAALWVYLAAFALRRSRRRLWPSVAMAGLWAALGFFTRMNHLLLLAILVVLLLPDDVQAGSWWRLRELWRRLPKPQASVYLACIVCAVVAIAARTWYYTGEFSLFLGTQRDLVSTGLGLSTIFSTAAWARALESVSMIVTVQDPPRLDPRGIVVTLGVVCAVAGLIGVPVVRRLPLALAGFCAGAVAGGLFVRGSAYAGRFSVQLVPVAIATATGTVAIALGRRRRAEEVHHE